MTKSCDNFLLNRRRRRGVSNIEKIIVSEKASNDDNLLKKPIEINEKQNELLSNNNKSPNITEKIILVFTGLTLISALASLSIAFLQLDASKYTSGVAIIVVTYILILIPIAILVSIVFPNLIKNFVNLKEKLSLLLHSISCR